jgi:protein-histidine N-methyltransferase
VRFQLSHAQDPLSERDERTAAFVDAPADLVPGTYEGGLKTWECALDLAAYLDRDVLLGDHVGVAAGRRVRGSRVLEVGFCSSDGLLLLWLMRAGAALCLFSLCE